MALLQFLGLVAIGLLLAPLIFYLMCVTASVVVLTVTILARLAMQNSFNSFSKVFNKFLWSADSVVYDSEKSKQKIYTPNYPHSIRVSDEKRWYSRPIHNLERRYYSKGGTNEYHLDTPNQAIATKLEKVLNFFHRIILFYRSYYGHSTKVEKNLFVQYLSDTSFCHCEEPR